MSKVQIIKNLKQVIKSEKNILKQINNQIKSEKLDIKNIKLFQLLNRASRQKNKIESLDAQLEQLKFNWGKYLMVGLSSKVYLVSSRLNNLIMVDARNYMELVGKKIGDAVTINNATFLVAGIYYRDLKPQKLNTENRC